MTDKIGYTRKGDIAVLRISNPPVNALSHAVREGLVAGMDRAEADDGVKAVVIVGDGRAFIAGADITEFGKTPLEPFLPDLCKRIEDSPLIVVASLHGVSLGGGLEVALSAHYRIAQPSAKVGLPEVHLGLIPGAGGTQRLPRLIGVDAALDLITTGRQVKADEADRLGIIDEITEGDPEEVGLAYAEKLVASNAPRRPISEMEAPDPIDWDAAYDGTLKKGRGQISPAQAVRAVQASVELPFHQGMQAEREMFMDLMRTDQRQGMIHAFFSERAVGNLPELKGVEPRALQSIGIIGGGTMGAGIATAALLAGFNVVLIEMKLDASEAARARISGNLSGALKRGKISELQFKTLTTVALEVSINYDSLASVDLVIEAVFEDMAVKKDVFGKLDAVC
ncbi:MAG: enoyl-CoA hydratase-related protein, partial [Sulfitobacter sp.]